MKRLLLLLLSLSALFGLAGCALGPAYIYNANAGGGYYSGQSPYGNASTVIYSSGYVSPWRGYAGWGPSWSVRSGWSGYGGIGFGATYVYRPQHRHWRRHHARHDQHERRDRRHHRHHANSARRARPAHRPPPVKALAAPPQRLSPKKH